MPSDSGTHSPADHRYRFWSQFTEAQAHNTLRSHHVIRHRVERFLRFVCNQRQPTLVLELGAHEAAFSAWAKRRFPDARCVALEANPYVYEEYRERLADSPPWRLSTETAGFTAWPAAGRPIRARCWSTMA